VTKSTSVYIKKASMRPKEEDIEDPDINEPTMVESIMESLRGKKDDEEADMVEEESEKKEITKGKKRKAKKKDKTE